MSVSSTPKRRKTVWNELLKNVSPSLIPESVHLEQVLSSEEDADVFARISEKGKRAILTDVLGDGCSDLVEAIIQSVTQSLSGEVTLLQRILSYDFAPSSKMKKEEAYAVADCIIEKRTSDVKENRTIIVEAVFGKKYMKPDSQPDLTKYKDELKKLTESINMHRAKTAHIAEEEPAGYIMLGTYAVSFADILSKELSKVVMFCNQPKMAENRKPGQNPKSDSFIFMLLKRGGTSFKTIPLVVYEYKPVVHFDPKRVSFGDLVEALLQAFYCLRFYDVPQIIHCLTDLNTWHYFKITKRTSSHKMIIEWCHQLEIEDDLNEEIVTEHASFLTTEVKKLVD